MFVVLTAGCTATVVAVPSRAIVVAGPPPSAPLAEERSAPPTAGAAWVPGYWHWTGVSYAWIPGHWESAPPGARWSTPRYSRTPSGAYEYEPGRWTR